jgi:hypothetical protein
MMIRRSFGEITLELTGEQPATETTKPGSSKEAEHFCWRGT